MLVYTAEITVYDEALAAERVLYCSTTTFVTRPTDTPGNQAFDPRLKQPGNFKLTMFDDSATSGPSRVGFGSIILSNTDGAMNALLDFGLDGRRLVIRRGQVGAPYPSGFSVEIVGTMEQPLFSTDEVTLLIRDRQLELNTPFQSTKYLGDNDLPNGLEGSFDILGKPKPVALGDCPNVTPDLVNTSRLIFQVNDGPVFDIPVVRDKGISLAKGADYASRADMETIGPDPGEYRAWLAGGYFRLGSSPAGQITADVLEGATPADRTCGQLVQRAVTRAIPQADIVNQSILDLDAANSSVVGIYTNAETTVASVLDALVTSIGAWYSFNNLGYFVARILTEPSPDETVITLSDADILNIERVMSNDQGRGIPAYRVNLSYDRNHTVQSADLAGAVDDITRQYLSKEFRIVTATDLTVKSKHLLAPELSFQTLLREQGAAQAEVDRRSTLFKVRRDVVKVKVKRETLAIRNTGFWEKGYVTAIPYCLGNVALQEAGGFAYAVGGFDLLSNTVSKKVCRLNLNDLIGDWETALPSLPAGLANTTAAVFNNQLFVAGGYTNMAFDGSDQVFRLDLSNLPAGWETATVLPQTAIFAYSALHDEHWFVMTESGYFYRLNLNSPTSAWEVLPTPPGGFSSVGNAVGHNGYFYVHDLQSGAVYRMDLSARTTWEVLPILPVESVNMGTSVVVNDTWYLFAYYGSVFATFSLDLNAIPAGWSMNGLSPTDLINSASDVYYGGNILHAHQPYINEDSLSGYTQIARMVVPNNKPSVGYIWDRGRVVQLKTVRLGFGSKHFRIVGAECDLQRDCFTLYLWG